MLKPERARMRHVESSTSSSQLGMASSSSVLRLYHEMLRNAAKLETYNFRAYATRRVKEDFRKNKALKAGSLEQEEALDFAREQANVLYRQMVVSKLYPPHVKSVMETLGK
ncbi:hypothetical protein JG688_00011880 [Phytophthora aleatoria]|uniref:Complex 1 LYR protein domain-containing protein n=1 Tax=Phytophthora aleatoria TaxID=2496075 RepID=A0A8J5INP2_9STRA|nr:hypothetical protein JG688_00011880 [Phytophthora aleatoria]